MEDNCSRYDQENVGLLTMKRGLIVGNADIDVDCEQEDGWINVSGICINDCNKSPLNGSC